MGFPGRIRGGSWNNNERNLRASNRNRNNPDNSNNNNGFRCLSLLSQRQFCQNPVCILSIHTGRAEKASAGNPRPEDGQIVTSLHS